MPSKHTVEKIGGTSMSRFDEVMRNLIVGHRAEREVYQRVFVVSAYGGITNMLLEDKKTGAPGVYAQFANGNGDWIAALEQVRARMRAFNRQFAPLGLDQGQADAFVDERIEGVHSCLNDLMRVRSFGHLLPANYLPAAREMLSAIGEAHSAYNSTLILQAKGIHARFVDLTCWRETAVHSLDEVIRRAFAEIDLSRELPVVTGYVKCDVGIMTHFERGYSEITFSKACVLTEAREGIIHKEFHLCTGDPVLIGPEKTRVIGNTNFDIADQMSDMNMEAIHARASKQMQLRNIPLRVKNAFDPDHPGTLITSDYVSPEPKVEMICGREDLTAVEVFDSEMVGKVGYDQQLLGAFTDAGISYIAKNTNANTITHYLPAKSRNLVACLELLRRSFPDAEIHSRPVAIVSLLGTNMALPGLVSRAARTLDQAGVEILGLNQASRRVSFQVIVRPEDSDPAQIALHRCFVEEA